MAISDLDGVVCPQCKPDSDQRPTRIDIDEAPNVTWWRLRCIACGHRWWIEWTREEPAQPSGLNIAGTAARLAAHHEKPIRGRKL